jgi:hypothetical protein
VSGNPKGLPPQINSEAASFNQKLRASTPKLKADSWNLKSDVEATL